MGVDLIQGGLVGGRILRAPDKEKKKEEKKDDKKKDKRPLLVDGIALAFRGNGDEVLFASRDEEPWEWIPVGDFVLETGIFPEYETVPEEEPSQDREDGLTEGPPQKTPPMGVRRRGGGSEKK